MENEKKTGAMELDDIIETDESEYILLTEGDYVFKVESTERGDFPGGRKIGPCPKVTLTVSVETDEGIAFCREDLLLTHELEWKLSAFFRSIGQKKKGERLKMNWFDVIGRLGRAHFKPRTYVKDGEERQTNTLVRFIDPKDGEDLNWMREAEALEGDELPL